MSLKKEIELLKLERDFYKRLSQDGWGRYLKALKELGRENSQEAQMARIQSLDWDKCKKNAI